MKNIAHLCLVLFTVILLSVIACSSTTPRSGGFEIEDGSSEFTPESDDEPSKEMDWDENETDPLAPDA